MGRSYTIVMVLLGALLAAPGIISILQREFSFGLAPAFENLVDFYRALIAPVTRSIANLIQPLLASWNVSLPVWFGDAQVLSWVSAGILQRAIQLDILADKRRLAENFPELNALDVETIAWRERVIHQLSALIAFQAEAGHDLSTAEDFRRLASALERLGRGGQASPLFKPIEGQGKKGTAQSERNVQELKGVAALLLDFYISAHPAQNLNEQADAVAKMLNEAGADPSMYGLESETFSRNQLKRFRATLSSAAAEEPIRLVAEGLKASCVGRPFDDVRDFLLNHATVGVLWRKRHEIEVGAGRYKDVPPGTFMSALR